MSQEPGHESEGVVGVYLTFPDAATAERVAAALVERRVAACVNLFPEATSVYRWEERVVREPEVIGWAKTTPDRLGALVAAIEELHPYEVPCAVAYPAVGGAAAYLDWVRRETDPGGPA